MIADLSNRSRAEVVKSNSQTKPAIRCALFLSASSFVNRASISSAAIS